MGRFTLHGAKNLLRNSFAMASEAAVPGPLHADLLDGSKGSILGIGSGVAEMPGLSPSSGITLHTVADTGSSVRVELDAPTGYKVGNGTPEPDYRWVAISDDAEVAWLADDKGVANPKSHTISGTEFGDGDLVWDFDYVPMTGGVGGTLNGAAMLTGRMYPRPALVGSILDQLLEATNSGIGWGTTIMSSATWTVRLYDSSGVEISGSGYAPANWVNTDIAESTASGYYLLNSVPISFSPTGPWVDVHYVGISIGGTPAWIGKIPTASGITTGFTVQIDPLALKVGFQTEF